MKEINELQVKLHSYLDLFLNGYSLKRISKLFYPIIDLNENYFRHLLPLVEKLNLKESKNLIKKNKIITRKVYAKTISTLYSELYDKIKEENRSVKISNIKSFEEWEIKVKDKDFLNPVFNIKKICEDYLN